MKRSLLVGLLAGAVACSGGDANDAVEQPMYGVQSSDLQTVSPSGSTYSTGTEVGYSSALPRESQESIDEKCEARARQLNSEWMGAESIRYFPSEGEIKIFRAPNPDAWSDAERSGVLVTYEDCPKSDYR